MNNIPFYPHISSKAHPHHTCTQIFTENYTQGITPDMLKHAYSFYLPQHITETSIAVISAFDNPEIIGSMRCFCKAFSLNVPQMETHYPLGKTNIAPRRWVIESCLDTQWAHVFSPYSKIHAVFSKDDDIESLLECAVFASAELKADIICMCFGLRELDRFSKYYEKFENLSGIFLSSSGDSGGIVSFPSTLPLIISVGGTRANITNGKKNEQTAWNFCGGGASKVFKAPYFQKIFYPIDEKAYGMRATPDLSFFADGQELCAVCTNQNGTFTTAGGTSLSCACMSGICALIKSAHSQLDTGTKMLSYLYEKAGLTQYNFPPYSYDDITVGKSGGFYAQEGFDFCTGLGTPVIKQLLT